MKEHIFFNIWTGVAIEFDKENGPRLQRMAYYYIMSLVL
jgi:hypothetical protein